MLFTMYGEFSVGLCSKIKIKHLNLKKTKIKFYYSDKVLFIRNRIYLGI